MVNIFESAKNLPETVLGSKKATVNLSAIAGALIPTGLRRLDPLFPGREYLTRIIQIGVPAGLACLGAYLKNDELHTAGIVGTATGLAQGIDSAGEYGYERIVSPETKARIREAELKAEERVAKVMPPKGTVKVVAPAREGAKIAQVPGQPYRPGGLTQKVMSGQPFVTPVSRKVVTPLR
jgi:hypothetical protein